MADQLPSNVHVSTHPCAAAKLSQLRSRSTDTISTKALVHEIATIVGCEALAHALRIESTGSDHSHQGYSYPTVATNPTNLTLVPILRSGLGMVDAVAALLPGPVPTHHLGMYREKSTRQPVEYYNNLPDYHADAPGSVPELAIVVDPVIATGNTMRAAIETLWDWGVKKVVAITVLGTVEGLQHAAEAWPTGTELWVAGVDPRTDDDGMIQPGLGDIGDRLFRTMG